jgi:hypothetical protein
MTFSIELCAYRLSERKITEKIVRTRKADKQAVMATKVQQLKRIAAIGRCHSGNGRLGVTAIPNAEAIAAASHQYVAEIM